LAALYDFGRAEIESETFQRSTTDPVHLLLELAHFDLHDFVDFAGSTNDRWDW
jgi:hypothetical protein